MLIFEGADNLGKTTAARSLCLPYQKMGRPPESFNFHTHYLPLINPAAVQDRFHLGSLAWHSGVMTEPHLRDIEKWLLQAGSVVVIFYAEDEDWYRSHLQLSDREQLFSVDGILAGNKVFKDIVHHSHELNPRYDFAFCASHDSPYPSHEEVRSWMEAWKLKGQK